MELNSWEAVEKMQQDFKGIYIRSLWPTIEEIKQTEKENPDYIVWGGYGCIYLHPKFD